MLEQILSPQEIKNCSKEELRQLTEELREKILGTVSETGGHLGSNLGVVELTVALHRVFSTPEDNIIFDVGHQCYAHKLLTGRGDSFDTLRQFGGISGFTNPKESPHDAFIAGHSGSSVAAALGVAQANKLLGNDHYAVAVVGDGSFTNGMIYEALNNCDDKGLKLIIVLNDNEMSISQNVGGLSRYFSKISTSKRYFTLRARTKRGLEKLPGGRAAAKAARGIKNFIKRLLVQKNLFECFGLYYFGPVDGHDIEKLEDIFREAKTRDGVCLVHAVTQKGRGYSPAEMVPEMYHGVGAFDLQKGVSCIGKKSFSTAFGEIMCELAAEDERVCAVTAAMCEGTGLSRYREKYPERFFDTGIAEEYAVAFCGGLMKKGCRPVCVLYSTFAQRVYDQVLHDNVLQDFPLILALDRSGLVPGDGITHQGIFDVALFSSIPGMYIYAPETYEEMKGFFRKALAEEKPAVIRYAKGGEQEYDRSPLKQGLTMDTTEGSAEKAVITYGRLTGRVLEAAEGNAKVIKLKQLMPLAEEELLKNIGSAERILVVEEGIRSGGVGEKIAALCAQGDKSVRIHAVEEFPGHGDIPSLDKLFGFDFETLRNEIKDL